MEDSVKRMKVEEAKVSNRTEALAERVRDKLAEMERKQNELDDEALRNARETVDKMEEDITEKADQVLAFGNFVGYCGLVSFGSASGTTKCLVGGTDGALSEGCAQCFGTSVACGGQHCMMQCLAGPASAKCLECVGKTDCNPELYQCTGYGASQMPPPPPFAVLTADSFDGFANPLSSSSQRGRTDFLHHVNSDRPSLAHRFQLGTRNRILLASELQFFDDHAQAVQLPDDFGYSDESKWVVASASGRRRCESKIVVRVFLRVVGMIRSKRVSRPGTAEGTT
ncbi:hypothetical protein FOZ62_032463 [Perkinsus olseni]|uniref:Uncharacterized protein n=1 Tax=Perkinsus olseni TaxID=32597 RepID=A0A7J6Q874_PEROL|nr:hypothetical protein FOZ62_032463 [Perkinsus olseni]